MSSLQLFHFLAGGGGQAELPFVMMSFPWEAGGTASQGPFVLLLMAEDTSTHFSCPWAIMCLPSCSPKQTGQQQIENTA